MSYYFKNVFGQKDLASISIYMYIYTYTFVNIYIYITDYIYIKGKYWLILAPRKHH